MNIPTFFRLLADMLFQWNHLTQFDKFVSWPRPTGQTDRGSTDRVSRFLPCGEKHERLRILSNHYMNTGVS